MNKNIKIAKQLIALAKELVAEKSRKAFIPVPWMTKAARFDLQPNWKEVNSYEQLLEVCSDVDFDKTSNCLLNSSTQSNGGGEHYFDTYGAPFYVYKKDGKSLAMMHEGSKQLKDIMTDMLPSDEDIKRSAVGVILSHNFGKIGGVNTDHWGDAEQIFSDGDFKSLRPYFDEVKEQWEAYLNGNGGDNIML